MKCISLWNPWASLIACGAKPFETRHWAPPAALIGQTIAIHAAKKVDRDAIGLAEDVYYEQHMGLDRLMFEKLEAQMLGTPDDLVAKFGSAIFPVGCVVCTATLEAAFKLGSEAQGTLYGAMSINWEESLVKPDHQFRPCSTVRVDDFGDYAPGRWAWLLRDVKQLIPPPPAVGRQGFFNLPQGWMTEGMQ